MPHIFEVRFTDSGLEQAAEYSNIKPVTLRKWIKQKEDLPVYQIGKLWKFKKAGPDVWVNSGKSAMTQE